jgi:glucose-6-phosphate 1-dehydrogenase
MQKPYNQILVIFGASGDLTERKLIPSLFNLSKKNLLPEKFAILGVSRTEFSDDSFRSKLLNSLLIDNPGSEKEIQNFLKIIYYQPLNTQDGKEYIILKKRLDKLNSSLETGDNYIYYLATPPFLYASVAEYLSKHGLNIQKSRAEKKRIIVEKPFGYNLESAKKLNNKLHEFFLEDQIYRIDHYLGKETVQNIMVTRFVNGFFEPIWNRNFIDHIEITSSENLGVEGRGGYYDGAGALRDMVQNHLLNLMAFVAMEPPASVDSNAVRNEILKVFQSLHPLRPKSIGKYVIRGQYTESVIAGKSIAGYRQEQGVNPESKTETYVALKAYIENWRWGGVPFYIRTGKRLPTRVTEIAIHFRTAPHQIFCADEEIQKSINQLIIRIQPDEGILLKFGMKVPGAGFVIQPVNMDFRYSELSQIDIPTAYERLLLDCMNGDSTLYARADAVEATWDYLQPVMESWKDNSEIKIYGYPSGTWGPSVADDLFETPGVTWRYPCKNLVNDGEYCEL